MNPKQLTIEYSYEHVPTILKFSQSDARVRGLMGPFGSGKSSGCVMEIFQRAKAQQIGRDGKRRTRWAIVRNSWPQLRDTSLKTFKDWFPDQYFGRWKESEHTYYMKFEDCEVEVMFRALDRPDHVKNLLSLELTGAWVNEAREIPWTIIQALQGRLGRYPSKADGGATWYGMFMDTNPPDTDSWWYKKFEEERPKGWEIYKQPSGMSPQAENIPNLPEVLQANYYPDMLAGMDEDSARVYVHGDYGFIVDGKPVFPEYSDNTHCKECEPIKSKTVYRGWDFGLTPAVSFSQLLPSGQWIIFDELIAEDLGIDNMSDVVLSHCSQNYRDYAFKDYGDPSGESKSMTDEKTCFQILHAKGIQIETGEQSPALRIEAVKKPLRSMIHGKPGLIVHPRCKVTRKAFQGGYHFRKIRTAQERFAETPDKNHPYSDIMDSLEYVATRIFGQSLISNTDMQKAFDKPLDYDTKWVV